MQYILCEILYAGFSTYKKKALSDIFNRNLSLHKLEGVMEISEGLANVTRIMLVLDIIAELYFIQSPQEYWQFSFHAEPEKNLDFMLRWKLFVKHSMLSIGPNGLLIINNAFLNPIPEDIKEAEIMSLNHEIELMSNLKEKV